MLPARRQCHFAAAYSTSIDRRALTASSRRMPRSRGRQPSATRSGRSIGLGSSEQVAQPSRRLPACRSRRADADRLAVSATAPALLCLLHPCSRFKAAQQGAARRQASPKRLIKWNKGGVQKPPHRHHAARQGNQPSRRHAAPVASLLNALTIAPLVQSLPWDTAQCRTFDMGPVGTSTPLPACSSAGSGSALET